MAEEQSPKGAPEGAPKKKLSLALVGLFGQLLLTIAAAGVIIKVVTSKKPVLATAQLQERAIASIHDSFDDIQTVNLDSFTVNLPGKKTLRVTLQVEVTGPDIAQAVQERMPALKSNVIQTLSKFNGKQGDQIQGKLLLKEALRNALNQQLEKDKGLAAGVVRDVYFVDFLLI